MLNDSYPVYILSFVYGLFFGSFFNVCILRIPKGLSIIYPASHCPKCKNALKWYMNIPVISYILLRGKCYTCKSKISLQYPAIELLTGIISLMLVYHFFTGNIADSIAKILIFSIFCGSLIILSLIDIRFFIIPDRFSIGGIIAGLFFSSVYPEIHGYKNPIDGFAFSLGSAIICFCILDFIRLTGSYVYKREAMGFGDIKLAGAFGAFLGWKLGLLSLFFGAMFGSVIGVVLIIASRYKIRSEIPFGPYLAMGAFTSLLYGTRFIEWYTNQLNIFY